MESTIPTYGHHSLLTGLDGDNLSKRLVRLPLWPNLKFKEISKIISRINELNVSKLSDG